MILKQNIFFLFLVLLAVTACDKDSIEKTPDRNHAENPYVERADSFHLYSGRNRLLLVGPALADNVAKIKVYWNKRSDSLDIKVDTLLDSIKVPIKNLQEGTYSFEIITMDKDNNSSGKVLIDAKVYGNDYLSNLVSRSLKNLTYRDKSLKLEWENLENITAIGSDVEYTDANGKDQQLFFQRSEQVSQIANLSEELRGSIKYRTAYLPEQKAIDTFYTVYRVAPYINRKAVFDSLPGWKFKCKVMAEAKTIEDYGSMITFKEKMDEAMVKASKKFQVFGLNDSGNNQIHFYMSEISPFTGASTQYTTKQWVDDTSLDIMLVVNDNAASNDDSWGWRRAPYLTVGHDYNGLFGSQAVDALAHELGHARGMYDLYLGEVPKAANNPISGEAYEAKRGMMNSPYGETVWAELSKFIINESAGGRVAKNYWDYFPEDFKIKVKQKNGSIAEGAKLNFYPVFSNSNAVRATDVIKYRAIIGTSGTYTFPDNPYAIDGNIKNNVYNYLVQIELNGEKQYRWMPLDEALLAGSNSSTFEFNIDLD
jgi:hypothetical protein